MALLFPLFPPDFHHWPSVPRARQRDQSHAERIHVEVQYGLLFADLCGFLFAQRNNSAEGFYVISARFCFGENDLFKIAKLSLFSLQLFDPFNEAMQLASGNPVGGFLRLIEVSIGLESVGIVALL